jgi:hypothetical protein
MTFGEKRGLVDMGHRSRTERKIRWIPSIAASMLAAFIGIGPAKGQPPEAEVLTAQGIDLRREHKNAEALEVFRKAFAVAPSPRIQAQIGLAEQALGQWIEAETDIVAALRAEQDPWIGKNRGALEQALGVVLEHLGWIEVHANVPGAETRINGARVVQPIAGAPVRVLSGTNVVEARAPGYVSTARTVFVLPNTRMRESITLAPMPSGAEPGPKRADTGAPAPAAAPSADPGRTPPGDVGRGVDEPAGGRSASLTRTVAFISLGAGIVGLGVGGYYGLRTLSLKKERDRDCDAAFCDHSDGVANDSAARDAALVSTIGAGIGLVATGVAVSLFIAGGRDQRPASNGRVHFEPEISRHAASLRVGGPW